MNVQQFTDKELMVLKMLTDIAFDLLEEEELSTYKKAVDFVFAYDPEFKELMENENEDLEKVAKMGKELNRLCFSVANKLNKAKARMLTQGAARPIQPEL